MGEQQQASARWYKQADGRLRYWSGAEWTKHFTERADIPIGWHKQPDGWFARWDGRSWSAAVPKPGQTLRKTDPPTRTLPALRLPLLAAAAVVAVALGWLVLAQPDRPVSAGARQAPTNPAG